MTTEMPGYRPDYIVYTNRSDNESRVEIGAAWRHENGEGIIVELHAIPKDGRFVFFPNDRKHEH